MLESHRPQLTGTLLVLNPDGTALVDQELTLASEFRHRWYSPDRQRTDGTGRLSIDLDAIVSPTGNRLPPKALIVSTTPEYGHERIARVVPPARGTAAAGIVDLGSVVLHPQPVLLAGYVVDPGGNPIACEVSLQFDQGGPDRGLDSFTKSDTGSQPQDSASYCSSFDADRPFRDTAGPDGHFEIRGTCTYPEVGLSIQSAGIRVDEVRTWPLGSTDVIVQATQAAQLTVHFGHLPARPADYLEVSLQLDDELRMVPLWQADQLAHFKDISPGAYTLTTRLRGSTPEVLDSRLVQVRPGQALELEGARFDGEFETVTFLWERGAPDDPQISNLEYLRNGNAVQVATSREPLPAETRRVTVITPKGQLPDQVRSTLLDPATRRRKSFTKDLAPGLIIRPE
ncbi:MAG: hypothetical protein R3F17_11380 [Planctomycetota bacterium]